MAGPHWLKGVLARAGAESADSLTLEAGTPAPQAWAAATRALGIEEGALAGIVARHFRLDVANLEKAVPAAARLLPEAVVRKHAIVPVRETDRELFVATCDPMDLDAEQAVNFASGRQAVFQIASPAELLAAIDRRYAPDAAVEPLLRGADMRAAETVSFVDQMAGAVAGAEEGESTSVVKLTNLILRAAIEHRASEVEIAPGPGGGLVSFRVDSVWRPYMQLPVPAMKRVMARMGILGNLGIANRAWSRGGGARIRIEGHLYDLRVTTEQTGAAERVRVRIYDQQFAPQLGSLGLSTPALVRLRALLDHGEGLVVIAGPPGQGKSTLLAAAARAIAAQRAVVSVEDPVEVDVDGIEQQEVDRHSGETLADVLAQQTERPVGVLAVNGVHDTASVERMLEIASGTLVLVTLNARRGADALRRLLDLGADAVKLPRLLRGVITVRLLRRLCDHCARPEDPATLDSADLRVRDPTRVRAAGACERCRHTGYRGVLPVLEIAESAPAIDESIRRGGTADAIAGAFAASPAFRAARTASLERVEAGETSLDEVRRVLFAEPEMADGPEDPVILIADDDPVLVALARTILEQNGYCVDESADGVETMERIAAGEMPALLILDLIMPRLDGHTVLDRLRHDMRTAGMPIIVLTASSNPDDELRAMELGADDYIRKPIDPPRFLARVRAALRRAAG